MTTSSAYKEQLKSALREFPAGRIYTLAPRGEVLDAMNLLRRRPVQDITWSSDGSGMVMEIADGRLREVSLAMFNGELSCSCDCGARSGCSHLIAALVTLKKLLKPDSFKDIPFDESYLQQLSAQLGITADASSPLPLRLVLEEGMSGFSMRLWKGDKPVEPHGTAMTAKVAGFMSMMHHSYVRENIFRYYLNHFGANAPIVFRRQGTETPLKFAPNAGQEARLLLELRNGVVAMRRVLEDLLPLSDNVVVIDGYLIDPDSGTIETINSDADWRIWSELRYRARGTCDLAQPDNHTLTVPAELFGRLSLPAPGSGCSLVLMIDGVVVEAESLRFEPQLRIMEADDKRFAMQAVTVAPNAVFTIDSDPFEMFCAEERWHLPPPLRTKKRLTVLTQGCFDLLTCHTAREENNLLKALFSGELFIKRSVTSDAKRFAKAFARRCTGSSEAVLLTDGARWLAYDLDRLVQVKLLDIPYRMFGATIFNDTMTVGEMLVPRSELLPRLAELRSRLADAGATLLFNGRPVRSVTWDITVDATRASIDWFELRPEVRCEGSMVTAEEMAQALQGGGIYQKDSEFVLLDDGTCAILNMLPKPEKKGKKADLVRIPRLQILDWLQLRKNGVKVKLSPEDEQIFSTLTTIEELPARPLPRKLDATLRHYQLEGYNWLVFLYEHRFGACLADDMGMGKTLQAITLLAGLHEGTIRSLAKERLPHLIVVPPSLLFNWEAELTRFYPGLKVTTYRGTDRSTDFAHSDVVLTSYGIVQRDAEKLAGISFNVIVFDEAQAVKNIQTDTTGACRGLHGLFTLVLTGTPVENHLGEYYSVMDIAVPGLLGEYEAFRKKMNANETGFLQLLIRRTRPFILRRTKSMIASELPPKIETDIHLELTERQKALYTKTVAEVKAAVDDAYRNNTSGQARIIALTAILRLRQLCLSPEMLLKKDKEASPKVEFLVEQLEELFDEGHSVLVFSQFTSYLDIVERRLKERKISFLRLDGSTEVGERKKLVNRFQKTEEPLAFLLSLKAGGKGLNLTRATYVFHLDPWWNPAVEDQASDRAHRIGQTRQVTITRLVMRHTIEEKMMELKRRKLALYKALLEDATTTGGAGISREDFEFLLE